MYACSNSTMTVVGYWKVPKHHLFKVLIIRATCHSLPFLFRLSRTWLFMSNLADVSRKTEDTYPTDALGPCSQFLVKSELLIYFCFFACIFFYYFMFFVVCVCFTCCLCPRITFFWFSPESWFPWYKMRWKISFNFLSICLKVTFDVALV